MSKPITVKMIKREITLSFYNKENGYFEKEFHTTNKNYRAEIRDYKKTIDAKYLGIKNINEKIYAVSMNHERFLEYADEIIELGNSDLFKTANEENESEEN